VDPRALELLREGSGLSIDLDGRMLHRGEPITHARTLQVLWRSLERQADGRYLVRVGRESAFIRIEDAPYLVRGLAGDTLALSDGSTEPLRPETLTVDREGILHCTVKGGHRARFSRSAQVALGLELVEEPGAPGGFALVRGGRPWPVGRE
jgi:uncharacterized protein